MKLAWGYIRTQVGTTVHKFWVARNIVVWVVADVSRFWHEEDSPMPVGQAIATTNAALAFWGQILWRALTHDLSKYRWDEARSFALTIDTLRTTQYGTDAYRDLLRVIKPAITLHYSRNRHHPEWHERGFAGMNKIDRLEMVADWGAAVRRHEDGDLDRSITLNSERFGYGDVQEGELRATARKMRLFG